MASAFLAHERLEFRGWEERLLTKFAVAVRGEEGVWLSACKAEYGLGGWGEFNLIF